MRFTLGCFLVVVGGYASSHDCRVDCGLRSADRRGMQADAPGERSVRGSYCQTAWSARKVACGHAQFAGLRRRCRCVRPRIPGLSPGRSGASPHVLRFPRRAFLRLPVCPPGSPPSSAIPWFPFVRRSPVRSLRPWPGSGSPSVPLRVPFPLGNLHANAAAQRFRRRWSPAAGTKVISPAAASCWIARCACTAGVQRPGTMRCRHRIT